jgi:hypothetical protein
MQGKGCAKCMIIIAIHSDMLSGAASKEYIDVPIGNAGLAYG